MERLLQLTLEDFAARQKTLLPVWSLGTGGDFGRLNPIARQLSFGLIVYMFYQELLDDVNRTREKMIQSVQTLSSTMRVESSFEEAEKIVDALLVSTESKKHLFTFQGQYFDEATDQWEIYQYQYLEIDRFASDLEEGVMIYKLTKVAQELFFNTNEIQQQLPVSLQQLLIDLLIEKGELKSALRILDGLIHRAANLLREEKIHKDELIRNPKETLYKTKGRWHEQLSDEEVQFNEEAENYKRTDNILRKIVVSPEHQETYLKLMNRIIKTRKIHDELAKTVIGNIRLEMEIRNKHFREMWLTNSSSFRKTIWEEQAKAVGFTHPEDMLALVESVLTPKNPTWLPIEWGLDTQSELPIVTFLESKPKESTQYDLVVLDWDSILLLWKLIFEELLKEGQVSLSFLQTLDEMTFARWMENREAFDFWLAFTSQEEPFIVNEISLENDNDDRSILLSKLLKTYPEMTELMNKKISSIPVKDTVFVKDKLDASIFIIMIEE